MLGEFWESLPYDGLWTDMNEIANFCTGACILEDQVPFGNSVLSEVIYTPGGRNLEANSISVDALHDDGFSELDYHSLYGIMQGMSTKRIFDLFQMRPFILSRSTFAGSGAYVQHWNGDNFANFDNLEYSIIGVMNDQFYGIPFSGSDICGFIGDTTEDLCLKWSLIGAFYPFSRNHNAIGQVPQEPYQFTNETMEAIKTAIQWKYSLLRYYYTEFWNIFSPYHVQATFWKPMFFEFPNSPDAYNDISRNIMLGQAIKLSPNIHPNTTGTVEEDFFFPAGTWCNLYDNICFDQAVDGNQTLSTATGYLNLHLREGWIIQFTDAIGNADLSVYELLDDWTNVKILLDKNDQATSFFHFDDGNQIPFDLAETFAFIENNVAASFDTTNLIFNFNSTVKVAANNETLASNVYLTINQIELLNANAYDLNTLVVKSCTYDDTVTIAADCSADAKYDATSTTGKFTIYMQTPLRYINPITVTVEFEVAP